MNNLAKVAIAIGVLGVILVAGILIVKEATTNHEEESIIVKGISWDASRNMGSIEYEDHGFMRYDHKYATFYYDGTYLCEIGLPSGSHGTLFYTFVGNYPKVDHVTWTISVRT